MSKLVDTTSEPEAFASFTNFKINISHASSYKAASWNSCSLTWGQLQCRLTDPLQVRRGAETVEEFAAMSEDEQKLRKNGPAFVGGELRETNTGTRPRRNGNFRNLSVLCLDADDATPEFVEFLRTLSYEMAVYSTYRSTPEHPRVRIIALLSRPVTETEYAVVAKGLCQQLGIQYFDTCSFRPVQAMLLPAAPKDAEVVQFAAHGDPVNPDQFLSNNAEESKRKPRRGSSKETVTDPQTEAAKAPDPRRKPGFVGAFCRVYSPGSAIHTFLPSVYLPDGDRFRHCDATSEPGGVVYGEYFYSYHNNTDICAGQLLNAFDLVRLHKFGNLDSGISSKTPVTKRPSYNSMIKLCRNDPRVTREMIAEKTGSEISDVPDWMVTLRRDKNGELQQTDGNLDIIISNDPDFKDAIAWNEMVCAPVVMRSTPWHSKAVKDALNGDMLEDVDVLGIKEIFQDRYWLIGKDRLWDGVILHAHKHAFHPGCVFLDAHPWDGIVRLPLMLHEYMGAEDTPINRRISEVMMMGLVNRMRNPGSKFDYMVILAGDEGIGKSEFLAALGGPWYTAEEGCDLTSRDAKERRRGFGLVELPELVPFNGRFANQRALNALLTMKDYVYRQPYARMPKKFPVGNIFVGTTNEDVYIPDQLGSRRYLPVKVAGYRKKLTDYDIAQLYAEADTLLKRGELPYFTHDEELQLKELQNEATVMPELAPVFARFLNALKPRNWDRMGDDGKRIWWQDAQQTEIWTVEDFEKGLVPESAGLIPVNTTTIHELFVVAVGGKLSDITKHVKEIREAMTCVEGWDWSPKKRRIGGVPQRYFYRTDTPDEETWIEVNGITVDQNGCVIEEESSGKAVAAAVPEVALSEAPPEPDEAPPTRKVSKQPVSTSAQDLAEGVVTAPDPQMIC